jgi:hypothetical protein
MGVSSISFGIGLAVLHLGWGCPQWGLTSRCHCELRVFVFPCFSLHLFFSPGVAMVGLD